MLDSHEMLLNIAVESPIGTFVSTYTGAGGMDIGFARAGFSPIWANDIDPNAVATYNQLFDGHVAHVGDIRAQHLPEPGSADLVIGGPPCQGFSVAGKMDPNDPRSRHVFDFLGVVAHIRPKVFVMENVKALAVNSRWSQIRTELASAAESLGYRTQLLLLNASHYGVPQARERMFLIGRLGGDPITPVSASAGAPPTVRHALENLPKHGEPGNDRLCQAKITLARRPVLRRSPYAGMLFNGQGRPLALDRPALTLPASMGGNRTPIVDQQELDGQDENWVLQYHEHLWAGGEPWDAAPDYLRRLTVEEAAEIQTFPRGMTWAGSHIAAYRQIGNAVPPNLAFHVAVAVRSSMGLGTPELAEEYSSEASATADKGRRDLLRIVKEILPTGFQLTMGLEEIVLEYARVGDVALLRSAVEKAEGGEGIEESDHTIVTASQADDRVRP